MKPAASEVIVQCLKNKQNKRKFVSDKNKTKINILHKVAKLREIKKSETHPIYSMKYLLHRRITVEEPHKRNGPVQCKLRSVCVACGDLHSSSQCEAPKEGLEKKCGNCGGILPTTANY